MASGLTSFSTKSRTLLCNTLWSGLNSKSIGILLDISEYAHIRYKSSSG
jgi:hypothetical protein